jgi:hypothetical protein
VWINSEHLIYAHKMKLFLLFTLSAFAQVARPGLAEISHTLNKSLPEVYDQLTKLVSTSVENNNFIYHFLVNANQSEFDGALPKVKAQILKTICAKKVERSLLKVHKAHLVYRYENVKGQSLGEFMVRPEHCL